MSMCDSHLSCFLCDKLYFYVATVFFLNVWSVMGYGKVAVSEM